MGSDGAIVGSDGAIVGSDGAIVGSGGAIVGSGGAAVGSDGAAVGSDGAAVGSNGASPVFSSVCTADAPAVSAWTASLVICGSFISSANTGTLLNSSITDR